MLSAISHNRSGDSVGAFRGFSLPSGLGLVERKRLAADGICLLLSSRPLGLVAAEASCDHFREKSETREKCVFRVSHSRMGVTEGESSGILTVWLRSFGFGI